MEANTLVKHKAHKFLGIGCVAKKLSAKARINFGLDGYMTCSLSCLEELDTTECKTISFEELKRMTVSNSSDTPKYVIIGNELRHYVGIGWVTERVIVEEDLKNFLRVI